MSKANTDPQVLGWREWLELPELGIRHIKAKVDTGARTSALHAFYNEVFERDGREWVRFGVHPVQGSNDPEIHCEAPIFEWREVTDSGGHKERRPVIETSVRLGSEMKTIEMTLTDRDTMKFRMLLGRTAIKNGFVVAPGRSYMLGGKPKSSKEPR